MKTKPYWNFILAHHDQAQCNNKCFSVNLIFTKVYLCSRCLGLYPLLFLTLFIDLFFNFPINNSQRALIFWSFTIWPWYHWAREAYFDIGTKKFRLISGFFAGIGTGVLLSGHLKNPWNFEFTFSALLIASISITVIFLKHFFND